MTQVTLVTSFLLKVITSSGYIFFNFFLLNFIFLLLSKRTLSKPYLVLFIVSNMKKLRYQNKDIKLELLKIVEAYLQLFFLRLAILKSYVVTSQRLYKY